MCARIYKAPPRDYHIHARRPGAAREQEEKRTLPFAKVKGQCISRARPRQHRKPSACLQPQPSNMINSVRDGFKQPWALSLGGQWKGEKYTAVTLH